MYLFQHLTEKNFDARILLSETSLVAGIRCLSSALRGAETSGNEDTNRDSARPVL